MAKTHVVPELKQILGALIFGANRPLSLKEMRRCLQGVAERHGAETAVFADVRDKEIREAEKVPATGTRRMVELALVFGIPALIFFGSGTLVAVPWASI